METNTTTGITGSGPAGLMLPHPLSIAGIAPAATGHRTRAETGNTARCRLPRTRQRAAAHRYGPGAPRRHRAPGTRPALRPRESPPRLQEPGRGHSLAAPADRCTHRPGRRTRATSATSGSASTTPRAADVTSNRPVITYTDADGASHQVRRDFLVRGRRVPASPPVRDPRRRYGGTSEIIMTIIAHEVTGLRT